MSNDILSQSAPSVDALTWVKGTHKGRAVQHLRTAMGHTLGVVITYPRTYREMYPGEGWGAGCWELPLYVDGQITTDPRRHRKCGSLREAKAALWAAVHEVATERVEADRVRAQRLMDESWERARDRERARLAAV